VTVRRPAEVSQRATLIAQGHISKEALRFAEATSKHREEQKERKEKRKIMLAELAARDKALKTLKARQEGGGAEKATIHQSEAVQAAILIQTPTLPLT
jgi:hypothetical protein